MSIFGSRLSYLRNSFNLSQEALVRLCSVPGVNISCSLLSDWESGNDPAELDSVFFVSGLFGVSLDWLFGRCDNFFNEDVIVELEPWDFPLVFEFAGHSVVFDFIHFPDDYIDLDTRRNNFSCLVRANILFLLYSLSFELQELIVSNSSLLRSDSDTGMRKLIESYLDSCAPVNAFAANVKLLNQVLLSRQPVFLLDDADVF